MELTYTKMEDLLREHRTDIYKRLILSEVLYAELAKIKVITDAEEDKLKADGLTDHEKKRIILDSVLARGVDFFLEFCIVLDKKELNLTHIVTLMGYTMTDIRAEKEKCKNPKKGGASNTGDQQKQPPEKEKKNAKRGGASNPGHQQKQPPEKEKDENPMLVQTAITALENPEDIYPMTSRPLGRAIIVSNEEFHGMHSDRRGGDLDAKNLYNMFGELQFEVILLRNQTAEEIHSLIRYERSLWKHNDYDAFVLCVLSHGRQGTIFGSDGGEIQITRDIVNRFSANDAPGLAQKPKMFFIQACQGSIKSTGRMTQPMMVMADGVEDRNSDWDPSIEDTGTHELADMLVVNSSLEGYASFRDTRLGSFFVRDLVAVFREYYREEHVVDMMAKVTRRLDARTAHMGHGQYKQICSTKSTLRRKVYFVPRYQRDAPERQTESDEPQQDIAPPHPPELPPQSSLDKDLTHRLDKIESTLSQIVKNTQPAQPQGETQPLPGMGQDSAATTKRPQPQDPVTDPQADPSTESGVGDSGVNERSTKDDYLPPDTSEDTVSLLKRHHTCDRHTHGTAKSRHTTHDPQSAHNCSQCKQWDNYRIIFYITVCCVIVGFIIFACMSPSLNITWNFQLKKN